jgi:hypothetical protein
MCELHIIHEPSLDPWCAQPPTAPTIIHEPNCEHE